MATTALPRTQVPQLNRLQTFGLIAAVVGLALLAVGWFIAGPRVFFQSYIFAFYFGMAFPIGCLGLLLIQHLTGGAWAMAVRRMLEAGALAMPVFFVLSIPVILTAYNVFGLDPYIYKWADARIVAEGAANFDPLIAHKTPWMSGPWFATRMVIYFAIWSVLALWLRRLSIAQDKGASPKGTADMMARISGFGIALMVLSVTFFAFDVGMSLDPHWFSTMYGAHYLEQCGLTTLCFVILALSQVRRTEVYQQYVPTKPIHDIGKLMFAFTVLWTYLSFGQYVIIWAGDVAEFTPWYLRRIQEGWIWVVLILMFGAFFLPFFALLGRKQKRNLNYLVNVAIWIILMRFIDVSWVILPEFHSSPLDAYTTFTNFAAPIGVVGIFLAVWAWNMQRAPLLPFNAPQMAALAAGGHH